MVGKISKIRNLVMLNVFSNSQPLKSNLDYGETHRAVFPSEKTEYLYWSTCAFVLVYSSECNFERFRKKSTSTDVHMVLYWAFFNILDFTLFFWYDFPRSYLRPRTCMVYTIELNDNFNNKKMLCVSFF